MSKCEIAPISGFQSTNLNSRVDNFNRLGDRVLRTLGYPFTNVEIHRDQLYENISIAIEYFSKFAGYTKEYLMFDSNLYKKDYGIKIDDLFTLQNSSTFAEQKELDTPNKDFTKEIDIKETVFVANSSIPGSLFSSISSLSSALEDGISANDIFTEDFYNEIVSELSSVSDLFTPQVKNSFTRKGTVAQGTEQLINSFDYDVMDYRKVIEVTDFEEGSNTGINTLFTLEQTLAQQTYFSYAMGNYGFDLVSWYTMKEWIDTREKVLALRKDLQFDSRTQYLKIYPEPRDVRFYGVISCYIERPIRDVIKEQWVYEYALALSMITVGRVRGKFGQVNLLGGGALNYDLIHEGTAKNAELETRLLECASPGLGDTDPDLFIVG